MKVANIKKEGVIYIVELKPCFLERLFNVKNKVKRYKINPDRIYVAGGGGIYCDQNGKELGNGNYIQKALDEFRRKW